MRREEPEDESRRPSRSHSQLKNGKSPKAQTTGLKWRVRLQKGIRSKEHRALRKIRDGKRTKALVSSLYSNTKCKAIN